MDFCITTFYPWYYQQAVQTCFLVTWLVQEQCCSCSSPWPRCPHFWWDEIIITGCWWTCRTGVESVFMTVCGCRCVYPLSCPLSRHAPRARFGEWWTNSGRNRDDWVRFRHSGLTECPEKKWGWIKRHRKHARKCMYACRNDCIITDVDVTKTYTVQFYNIIIYNI